MRHRVAVISIPEHADKRKLIPPPQRGKAAVTSLNRGHIDDAGVSELSRFARAHLADHRPGWWTCLAPPNNDFSRRTPGDLRGSAIIGKRNTTELVDGGHLHVRMDGRPRGLNMPIALIEDESGLRLRVHGHNPRVADDLEANLRALWMEVGYCAKAADEGYPVELTLDSNNGAKAVEVITGAGGIILARDGVDLVAGWGVTAVSRPSSLDVDWSDHPRLSVTVKSKPPTVRLSRRCPNP